MPYGTNRPATPPLLSVFRQTWPLWRLASVAIRRWIDIWRLGALHRPGQRRWRYRGAVYRWFERATRVSQWPYDNTPMGLADNLRQLIRHWTVYYGGIDRFGCTSCGFAWIPPANFQAVDTAPSRDAVEAEAVVYQFWCPRCGRAHLTFG